ncbi:FUSC family protein [Nocardioides daejeonensis]|uniref:FUSC family protein n=1 Tax=Nocardioides daejeonensis TaxID=1046556 RepID=UPI0019524DEE|nr:FUSC family protein [Nocardioides daejeonensis]
MSPPESRPRAADLLRVHPAPGSHRVAIRAGVSVGVPLLLCLAAALLLALQLGPVGVVLTVIVLQFVTEMLVGKNYGLALLFITPLALLIGQLAVERPAGSLLLDRGIETLIGSAVALVMVWLELRRQTTV